MQKLTRTCKLIVITIDTVLAIISTTRLYASVFLSVKLCSQSFTRCPRECVYLSKIENSSYHQKLVSHPISEHVNELSSLVRLKLQ